MRFANKADLDKFINDEKCWSPIKSRVPLEKGFKTILSCNQVKRRGSQCATGLYYLESADPTDQRIKLFKRSVDHTCKQSENRTKSKVSEDVRKFILIQYKLGNKAGAIIFKLREMKNIAQPSKSQVDHIIQYSKQKTPTPYVSISDMEKFFNDHRAIPDDEDEAFVVNFNCSPPRTPDGQKFFRIFYSTKRLLSNALKSKVIHADGTHKIIVQGYPILVVGVSDRDNHFHLCGMGITSSESSADYKFLFEALQIGVINVANEDINPESLVADAAVPITNGFAEAFDDTTYTRIHCFAHMMKNVFQQKFRKAENKEKVMDDLRSLQLITTKELFDKGWTDFVKKWKNKEQGFVNYFYKNHVQINGNWYEGSMCGVPKTNNCLETFNRLLKQQQTFYLRQPLNQFIYSALKIVTQRSTAYKEDKQPPKTTVTFDDELRLKAWNYANSDKSFAFETSDGNLFIYAFSGDNMNKITMNDVRQQENYKPKNFDDFIKNTSRIYKVTMKENDLNDIGNDNCTCASFSKQNTCKHILAIAYQLKVLCPPDSLLKKVVTPAPKKMHLAGPKRRRKRCCVISFFTDTDLRIISVFFECKIQQKK